MTPEEREALLDPVFHSWVSVGVLVTKDDPGPDRNQAAPGHGRGLVVKAITATP